MPSVSNADGGGRGDVIQLDHVGEATAAAGWESLGTECSAGAVHPPIPAGADRASAAAAAQAASWIADDAGEATARATRIAKHSSAATTTVSTFQAMDADSAGRIASSVKGINL